VRPRLLQAILRHANAHDATGPGVESMSPGFMLGAAGLGLFLLRERFPSVPTILHLPMEFLSIRSPEATFSDESRVSCQA
jgi:hypothetical protein